MTDSTSPDRSINVFNSLKIFKTNDFAQIKERYRSLDKIRQEHMIGNLMADLSHVTIQGAIENLQQADETLAASVAKGVRGYIKIKKRGYFEYRGYPRILYFLSRNHPLIAFTLAFGLPDCYARLYFRKLKISISQRTHSFQAPLLPELELLLAGHPVAAVTVGLVL